MSPIFNRDYSDPDSPSNQPTERTKPLLGAGKRSPWKRLLSSPRARALGLGLVTALASGAIGLLPGAMDRAPGSRKLSLTPGTDLDLQSTTLPNPLAFTKVPAKQAQEPEQAKEQAEPERAWKSFELRKGETLSQLGERAGIGARTAWALARASRKVYPVRRLRSGHTVRVRFDAEGEATQVRYRIDPSRYVEWRRGDDGGFQASLEKFPRVERIRTAFGRIDSSLFQAGGAAGLPDRVTMQLAHIFGWDIDFAHDLRKGDWFRVLYKEYYRKGKRVGFGPILAAEFVIRGESHKAIRFTDARGHTDYYQPDGHSVRKAFLRNPVKFTRITSRFSRHRKHPILHRTRPHLGVDFGAPTGTPIHSTGNGRIIFRGRKGGYGRVVVVRHTSRYSTLYAHMSRFGHFRKGQRVKQGQVVGYVGQSGLATGPHLHYEFRVNGRHRNPLTVKLPQAAPLAKKYQAAFGRRRHHLTAWLDAVGPAATRVASSR
ncbi:MAG TPA: peptidoglycan DD-metalloendopeptidase family protein [Gammaproteobacteria bacterium]|nr:peptidoglycan DD-metalloendopeptidase family protein [Gammaproteobacteria bacterium]